MRYAAFMRGLNLGKRNVKMDDLKKIFVKLGFKNVESFIASGNIVFETPAKNPAALEKKIAAALETTLGYEVATFLRDFDELAVIAGAQPFKGITDGPLYLVGLLHQPPDAAAKKRLMALSSQDDRIATTRREMWWYSEIRQSESQYSTNDLEKALGVRATWRNLRTVRKMVAKWGG